MKPWYRADKPTRIDHPEQIPPTSHLPTTKQCPHQLTHRTEHSLPRRQAQAAITAAATAIHTATDPETARARALRTGQTETDQTVIADMAKTKNANATNDDTETLPRNP
jgi:hypothetical protein